MCRAYRSTDPVQLERLPTAIVAAATMLALASAWHSGRHMWHRLVSDYHTYAAMTPTERKHAPLAELDLDGNVFDWYAQYVARGDRIYYQVLPSGLGTMDLPTAVRYAGAFYLLPAAEVSDPKQATVIVSFMADPTFLHLRFLTQQRSGLQPIFVSRVRAPVR
jgi:hypothetical protein